jgi:hypothetical protein
MGELKSSEQEILGYILVTHPVTASTQKNFKKDVCRDFDEIEGSFCPLIEGSATLTTAKSEITLISGTFETSSLS